MRRIANLPLWYRQCWVFPGSTADGYGQARVDGRRVTTHREAYETLVGPIPPRRHLDHVCRNRRCYNPTHLEPVTRSANQTRRRRAMLRESRNQPRPSAV